MAQTNIFILYVSDQNKSRDFYQKILKTDPILDVEGMTEFPLPGGWILGLMPESGIARIITPLAEHPAKGNGIPRCELYLYVDDPVEMLETALRSGAKLASPPENRNWGDKTGYCIDPDGHIIAFARKID
jgi:lactoylglutathione lyase